LEHVRDAFIEAGHEVIWSPRARPVENTELVVTAGFQITNANADAMARGVPIIILENPVWHDGIRQESYTWAYNGLHGGGTIAPTSNLSRRPHPPLKPWKAWESGQKTIFGQVPTDKAVRGHDLNAWRAQVETLLPDAVYREHPIMIPSKDHPNIQPFDECLDVTTLAITFTSTCGAEAVIAGIPTIACHSGSLAYPVSSHSLQESPITPDREEWIHALSWRNWSINEKLDTGFILNGYDEARANAEAGRYDNMSNGRAQ
jgi:hypothetical protein